MYIFTNKELFAILQQLLYNNNTYFIAPAPSFAEAFTRVGKGRKPNRPIKKGAVSIVSSSIPYSQAAAEQFSCGCEVLSLIPFGDGHINDTFRLMMRSPEGKERHLLLQRFNTHVFPRPYEVMENIQRVTDHLRKKILAAGGDPERETLNVCSDKDGKSLWFDPEGGCWRAFLFIDRTVSYSIVSDPSVFRMSGEAFGRFQCQLADFPAHTLHEAIAHFHDTPDRFQKFQAALAADPLGRAAEAQEEIRFLLDREDFTHLLTDQLAAGELPLRCTHNDTKMNNLLLDETTRKAVCVIDLDTVMPGLAAYDFGDSIRFGANPAAEDEKDLSKVRFSLPLFAAYAQGFLSQVGDTMKKPERDSLLVGAKMMTLECGMRFLTDYLEGDTYFKIHRPEHNLDRTRTQLKLVADMENCWDDLQQILDSCAHA